MLYDRAVRRESHLQWRYLFVGGLLGVGALLLGVRFLILMQDPKLAHLAKAQQTKTETPFVPRLTVIDRQGSILATDSILYSVYFHPRGLFRQTKIRLGETTPLPVVEQTFRQQVQVLGQLLAPLLNKPSGELVQLLGDRTRSTVLLAREVDGTTRAKLLNLIIPSRFIEPDMLPYFVAQDFPVVTKPDARGRVREIPVVAKNLKTEVSGLDFNTRRQRTYPQGEGYAALVGFIGQTDKSRERVGISGIEQFYEKQLLQIAEPQTFSLYGQNQYSSLATPLPSPGQDRRLQLTLDARLQATANRTLAVGMAKFKAKRGAVIVLEAQTGAIRALAVAPTYDNNRIEDYVKTEEMRRRFRPWVVSDIYEPGSTFKPINIALGLDSGKVRPTDVVYDPGALTLSGRTIKNFDGKGRGSLSVTKVLQVSNNIGMVKLMQKVGAANYYDRLMAMGIGQSSGVDLIGEGRGVFKDKKQFVRYPIEAATPAFGQGITMTPLQLLRFHGAIANGGWLVTPQLGAAWVSSDGSSVQPIAPPTPPRRIFSEASSKILRNMLIQVVEGGSGKAAQVPGYWVGGKTGTAQKVRTDGRGYVPGARVTSFVGYFPGDAPRYVLLTVFDEPEGRVFGGNTAAPIVQEMIRAIIGFEGIRPTRKLTKNQIQTKVDAQN